ncbi:MAG: YcgN family cysteine cluster protein [Alphaproteobacteria bacterium]|nr:YcgN family cysteine cluster protein [Alphaproteobacteria bacterium]
MARSTSDELPFWRAKALKDLSNDEWESLCDRCGKCCLEKLEDPRTGEITYTNVACALFDLDACRCANYVERRRFMPDCVPLNPKNVKELRWMPSTCAYRLLAEGMDLPDWHPLVSGDPGSVEAAGMSVRGRCVPATEADDLEDYIVDWPR